MTETNKLRESCIKAVSENKDILNKLTIKESPVEFARASNIMGGAYGTLATIENKAESCKNAIAAFEDALKVYTLKEFPVEYAKTHSNLGNVFGMLASIENKDENCIKAFQSFLKAFNVFNAKDYPEIYSGLIENVRLHLPVCEKLKRKLGELFNSKETDNPPANPPEQG
jgi:gamma-glutamylcyclotransferase (GGCT)/AIG2-like uncharacterized protein YtfP